MPWIHTWTFISFCSTKGGRRGKRKKEEKKRRKETQQAVDAPAVSPSRSCTSRIARATNRTMLRGQRRFVDVRWVSIIHKATRHRISTTSQRICLLIRIRCHPANKYGSKILSNVSGMPSDQASISVRTHCFILQARVCEFKASTRVNIASDGNMARRRLL